MPGVILVNPSVFNDKRDAMAVIVNEALRLFMDDTKFRATAEPTPEQRQFFKGTAYEKDDDALRKTILARVATFDTSVNPTPEQVTETRRLLGTVMEAIGQNHADYPLMKKIDESLGANGNVNSSPVQTPAQTEGTRQDDMLGGNVSLGKLDPTTWGISTDTKPSIRADTRTEAELQRWRRMDGQPASEKSVLRSGIEVPTTDEIIGVQPSGNPIVDTINRIVGAATTFGPAPASLSSLRMGRYGKLPTGPDKPGLGGLAKAAGASSAVNPVYEFEGKELSPWEASILAAKTAAAERGFLEHIKRSGDAPTSVPKGITFSPYRAYRRIGGVEGLRDLVERGGMYPPKQEANAKPTLGINLKKTYGTVYLMHGKPPVEYEGPITVETLSNAVTAPEKYGVEKKHKNPYGYIYAKKGGETIDNIARIFDDSGFVIYSKERDGLANFATRINEYMESRGGGPPAKP